MNLVYFAAALFLMLIALHAQAQTSAVCAQVEVHNVRPQQGHLMLAAFNSADTFQKQPIASQRVAAGDGVMRLQVCGLVGEAVALTLFQDLDSDGKMGRNLVGMPTEPWGSSGVPGAMGPTWEASRVPLDGSTIVVKLSH